MGIKRVLWISASAVLLLAGAAWGYRYYLLHKPSLLKEHIPAEATAVVYVNTRVLWQQFSSDKTLNKKAALWKRSEYLKHIQGLGETGIDLGSDMALVEYQGFRYGLMLINDRSKLEQSIQNCKAGLFRAIEQEGDYHYVLSLKDSFKLIWTENTLVFLPASEIPKCNARWNKFMFVEAVQSFAQTKACLQSKNDTVPLWFYAVNQSFKGHRIPELKGCLMHHKNGLRLLAAESPEAKLEHTRYSLQVPDSLTYLYADTAIAPLNKLLSDLTVLHLGSSSDEVTSLNYSRMRKTLLLGGMEQVDVKTMRYIYDDNFNRVMQIVVKKDSIRAASFAYNYTKDTASYTIYNNTRNSALLRYKHAPDVGTRLSFDQNLFAGIIPAEVRFRADCMRLQKAAVNHWQFDLKSENWEALLEWVFK